MRTPALSDTVQNVTPAPEQQPDDAPDVREEVLAGRGIALSRAARNVGVTPMTIWRWTVNGVALPDGTRVRLAACRLGTRWRTTEAALRRFVRLTTGEQPPEAHRPQAPPPLPAGRTPRRAREVAQARDELRRLGI